MKYTDYLKLLKKHNIFLHDCEYRISYFRLLKLSQNIYENQKGGYKLSPINILKNSNNIKIKNIINALIDNNLIMAEYICSEK